MNRYVKAHIYIDGKLVTRLMRFVPRVGEVFRYDGPDGDAYATVTDVCWCLNEQSAEGERVNISTKPAEASP